MKETVKRTQQHVWNPSTREAEAGDHPKFQPSLGYRGSSCLKKKTKTKNQWEWEREQDIERDTEQATKASHGNGFKINDVKIYLLVVRLKRK